MVEFSYPGTNSIYFTICDNISEMLCVVNKFPTYYTFGDNGSEEEYEKYKKKDWWLGKMYKDENARQTICTLEKTTLPAPNL